MAVGGGQGAAGQLDAGPGERLGWEGDRPGPDHLEPRALGVDAVEEVEHDVGAEAGGPDAEAGEAEGVRRAPGVRGAEERAEARAGVDRPAPAMGEPQPLELREG